MKWYIEDFENIYELNSFNAELDNNNERLLSNEKYRNMDYKIVINCPKNKPYIIYSIRQCVSSCNSLNLLEFGLFMTKKLYLYNNICYNECPYGSIKNNQTFTCDEVNKYISVDNNISVELFIENSQNYINEYLSEYANNSVGINRINDFSNYLYNIDTNNSFKMELYMPIFDFSECIEKMKLHYQLNNNINIFSNIMEFNTQVNKDGKFNYNSNSVNSTTYQFF